MVEQCTCRNSLYCSLHGEDPMISRRPPYYFGKTDKSLKPDDKTTSTSSPYHTIIDDKVIDAINDSSVKVPVGVGFKTAEEFEELLKELITGDQLDQIKEFLSDYNSNCPCIPMENTCLAHQIAYLFDLETPNPTEYKTYPSVWHLLPRVKWDAKGYRVIPEKEVEE